MCFTSDLNTNLFCCIMCAALTFSKCCTSSTHKKKVFTTILNKSCRLCLHFRCRLEPFVIGKFHRDSSLYFQLTCIRVCVCVALCSYLSVDSSCCVEAMRILPPLTELIKVSWFIQQLMVNLASFSHSPTHGLTIFPPLLSTTLCFHIKEMQKYWFSKARPSFSWKNVYHSPTFVPD